MLHKFVTMFFVFMMYFSGGLIPGYLLIRDLGVIGVFNMIVIRSFIEGLPEGILESARIDGAVYDVFL